MRCIEIERASQHCVRRIEFAECDQDFARACVYAGIVRPHGRGMMGDVTGLSVCAAFLQKVQRYDRGLAFALTGLPQRNDGRCGRVDAAVFAQHEGQRQALPARCRTIAGKHRAKFAFGFVESAR